ncbi:disabled homolog 1-like isoform X2 [Liolophura sinensis]|uniref:disabled homolog 1-like isoform X2 n=1 Tax=Liolophura sinensis TaxID=3198878 RepID=UPI003158FC5B
MSQKLKGKKDKNDPSRFQGEGVNFRAKLIGVDDVESARGDKMCQESLQKLKAAVKASGEHKQRILVNVSLEGLTLIDERTKAIEHNHAVHRISFISRDVTDNRAFGYIYGVGDGTHKFFAIKTLQAAEYLVLTLRDLFQCVYELKKQEMEEAKSKQETGETTEGTEGGPKEGGDNIYQVPTNGAPVEGKEGESIYQVPGSNAPVNNTDETDTANLLDLENELQSLQEGIQQMDTFEDIFGSGSGQAPPAEGTAPKSDPWGAPATSTADSSGFGDSFGATSNVPANNNDPFQTAFSTPSTAAQSPFSAPPAATTPFSAPLVQMNLAAVSSSPFQSPAPAQTMAQPGGFGSGFITAPTSMNPMAGLSAPPMQSGFGQPTFGTAPSPALSNPLAGGIFGTPVHPGMGYSAPPAATNPFSAGGFAGPPAANPIPSGDMFGGAPVMMPTNTNAPAVPPRSGEDGDQKPRAGSDLFGDLCEIGPSKTKGKSPKQLFEEQKAEPKRTLNELKVVPPTQASLSHLILSSPSPTTKTNSFCDTADHFEPFPFPDDNNPADPFHPHKPDSNNIHFLSQSSSQIPMNGRSALGSSGDDDFFDMPSPLTPPPPLPGENTVNGHGPPLPPPRPGVPGLKSIPRPRGGKSNTPNTQATNKTVANGSALLNFAVSNPFDDPFFTNGDMSGVSATTVIVSEKSRSSTVSARDTSAPTASPFGDFSIFGAPPPSSDPVYATVNKNKPPDGTLDLL